MLERPAAQHLSQERHCILDCIAMVEISSRSQCSSTHAQKSSNERLIGEVDHAALVHQLPQIVLHGGDHVLDALGTAQAGRNMFQIHP